MLKKIIFTTLFISCFVFVYSKESLFDFSEENPFGLSSEKLEVIKKLYETEGLTNGWFKACIQDFVKYAKEYDKAKLKSEETIVQIKNNSIKILMFTVLSELVIPSFDNGALNEYIEAEGFNKILDDLSNETTNYIYGIGQEIMGNLGMSGGEVNHERLNQYVDIIVDSIKEYLKANRK